MTPDAFIAKWRGVELKERSASQSHFNDLCALLGVPDPVTADPTGADFTFEKGAIKSTGAKGWADVWKRSCFAWEYKGRHANLDRAYAQVQQYSPNLDYPPLLIVSDMERVIVRTAFTGMVSERHDIALEDLRDAAARDLLRHCFEAPERLRPRKSRADVTEEAASRFAALSLRLRRRGHDPMEVAHFVNRIVFCMFAEDVALLPDHAFSALMKDALRDHPVFEPAIRDLFARMHSGGLWGGKRIHRFNGGLFDGDAVLPVEPADLRDIHYMAGLDWSQMEPSIFGTLFERGLDPEKRSQLGAHYTDEAKIRQIVGPVVVDPLRAEWADARAAIEARLARAPSEERDARGRPVRLLTAAQKAARTRAEDAAARLHRAFKERLKAYRVLDPACGSGNFLNVALRELKSLELVVDNEAATLGLPRGFPEVGPEVVHGIELNPYAAELAGVSVWIADIQWMREFGFEPSTDPVLRPLGTIECRDAVLAPDGARAGWPEADAIVGNPPFLGDRRMISELGESYVARLRKAWKEVPGASDLVGYWFAAAGAAIRNGRASRVGFVATNSIRGGANRMVLKPLVEHGRIFEAWSDEPWTVEGAAVRVSLICFDGQTGPGVLNGVTVDRIASDLSGGGTDLTVAARLSENKRVSFIGTQKNGPFDIDGDIARKIVAMPLNPNGRANSDVVRPWTNGAGLVRRNPDRWIIDFGTSMTQSNASFYEAPFQHVVENVRPLRVNLRRQWHRTRWWLHGDPRPALRNGISNLSRFTATPLVSKHRIFVWLPTQKVPENTVIAIARDDDTAFGILHSRFHELWSLRMGTFLGKGNDPRYTPSTTFETFPFPGGLTPDIPAADYAADPRAQAIADAAHDLNEKREAWLNPPDLIRRVPEVVPGYPDRLLPVDAAAAAVLKTRTLTALYNARPAWLAGLHDRLDAAVAAAYGWPADMAEEDLLAALLALNRSRAATQADR